ncbi:UdgX family uracil-DNA binding protein [Aporhodopirellula aestuarii]|uniref:Type-4 uracil-DNA glycosylase n=1 Tax=Aporhodopirellula aestuarii TaxID=2950107 RepID=A0ABT0UDK0_9BACT|nr:UdgX family uracil-DNA binding protein [Aporhodopirellula aestuarii]MCM2374814.1 UdgX family uracil-DNA binding protein [Aporhodopirellula aestuarii]
MERFVSIETYEQWRTEARRLLGAGIAPSDVHFSTLDEQPTLFADTESVSKTARANVTVPKSFLEIAQTVACHQSPVRWELLYRTLWRLTHNEPALLQMVTDDDVHELHQMKKAVTRDVHKMKAFVRFRRVASALEETYVAWHRPDHRIVSLAAPFFARRFKAMNWSIFTPIESVVWDQQTLRYGAGVPASEVSDEDSLESLWKTYYASIFNPARVKVAMMKREMPVRHWQTLPEASIIQDLLDDAPQRVADMIERNEGFADTATKFLPPQPDLDSLASAVNCCEACDLHQFATQAVFGEGPRDAKIVLVGEQPGDREDIAGKPFVGPAGELLDRAFAELEIGRDEVYITNVVKHFKFTQRGKRRLHKKPNSREIYACRPWLEAELAAIQPHTLVCLGATPAQALIGRDFRITASRGVVQATEWCQRTIATWHPAAILRMPDAARKEQMFQEFVGDLAKANAQ